MAISTKTALAMRNRGLRLPVTIERSDAYIPVRDDIKYENTRVREIAAEQRILFTCLEQLDMELLKLSLIESEERRRNESV